MAAKGAREPITLECTECKRRTYMTEKNKKNNFPCSPTTYGKLKLFSYHYIKKIKYT